MKNLKKILTILMCLAFVFAFASCADDELTDEDTEMTLKISFSNFTIAGGNATVTYGTSEKTGAATATVSADGKSAEATLLREYCNSDDKFTTVSYSVKDASGNAVELASSYATSFKFKKKSKSVTLKAKSSSSSTGEEPKTADEQSDISNEKMTLTVKFYLCDEDEIFYENNPEGWYTSVRGWKNDRLYSNKGYTLIFTYGSSANGTAKIEKIITDNSDYDEVFSVSLELEGKYASNGVFDKIEVSSVYIEDGEVTDEFSVFACPPKLNFNKNGATLYVVYEKDNDGKGYIVNGVFDYKTAVRDCHYTGFSEQIDSISITKSEGISSEKMTIDGFEPYNTSKNGKKYCNSYRFAITGDSLTEDDWFALSLDGTRDEGQYFEFEKCYSASGFYFVLHSEILDYQPYYKVNSEKSEHLTNAIAENGFYLYSSAVSDASLECHQKKTEYATIGE